MGIALVAARAAQVPVTLVDTSQASLDKGLAFADKLLAKDVSKQKISREDADAVRGRITATTKMDTLSNVDMVIEAVPEVVQLKTSIFAELAATCPAHAILATNTSSISITRIAAATTKVCPPRRCTHPCVCSRAFAYLIRSTCIRRFPCTRRTASYILLLLHSHTNSLDSDSFTQDPTDLSASSRVISTHFMNPVPVQKGVEIISGLQTSPSTLATALEFCRRMGKVPSTSADSPGFLANRILMPYINEAIICLETGVGDEAGIDSIMKNGTNVPMGPLQLADFIGLDTCLSIMEVLHKELGDSKYRPAVRLRLMVDAGWLGKKSGKGFYTY